MNKRVKLVLSGSGTLYPAHVGAVLRLAEAGYEFDEVVGTSGGSLIAAALASGYKPNAELVDVVKKTIPSKNRLVDPSVWALFTKWGFIKGDKIEKVLDKYFVKKLREAKIPLHIVTCNIDRREMKVFSSANDPDMDLSLAVRASMSIPGVFVPVKLNGELHVDGGLAGNFLIDYFDDKLEVIGVKFKSVRGKYDPVKNAFEYTSAVIDTMLEANTAERIEDTPHHNVIMIESKHNGLNLNMTEADVLDMISEGYKATDKWLKNRG